MEKAVEVDEEEENGEKAKGRKINGRKKDVGRMFASDLIMFCGTCMMIL